LHAGDNVTFSATETSGVKTITKLQKQQIPEAAIWRCGIESPITLAKGLIAAACLFL
jgi:hypothetical protein